MNHVLSYAKLAAMVEAMPKVKRPELIVARWMRGGDSLRWEREHSIEFRMAPEVYAAARDLFPVANPARPWDTIGAIAVTFEDRPPPDFIEALTNRVARPGAPEDGTP